MNLKLRTIFKTEGQVLIILGISMLLPFVTALAYGETASAKAFAYVALPCSFLGFLMMRFINFSEKPLRLRDGFFIVAVSWLLAAFIGSLPMLIDHSIPHFFDSFFEMCSGFTTTGATVLDDVESMPRAVLMWRAFSHSPVIATVSTPSLLPRSRGSSAGLTLRSASPPGHALHIVSS